MPIKRTYAEQGDACAAAHAMELIGDRWSHPILRELMLAPKRFGELQDALFGITPAVLTARLRQLEESGLVRRCAAPGGGTTYELTPWAQELKPVFEALGRWAHQSPTWHPQGNGLTPDGAVQAMLTMAGGVPAVAPVELELRLHDARISPDAAPYRYRITWADGFDIVRGAATRPVAVVSGDSTAWVGVLFHGAPLDAMIVEGDEAAVRRLVDAFRMPA